MTPFHDRWMWGYIHGHREVLANTAATGFSLYGRGAVQVKFGPRPNHTPPIPADADFVGYAPLSMVMDWDDSSELRHLIDTYEPTGHAAIIFEWPDGHVAAGEFHLDRSRVS